MNPQVLLVDSNTDGLELYATALALAGIDSATASSAGEALDRVEAARPRAIVTGIRLPGIGGAELIARVRRDISRCRIFIVALTTNETIDGRKAREAGCDLVLKLPCLPETLVSELRRVLA